MMGLLTMSSDIMTQPATFDITVIFIIISLLIAIFLPTAFIFLGIIKFKGSWKQIFSGILGYLLFSVILKTLICYIIMPNYQAQESDYFTENIQLIIMVFCTEIGRYLLLFLARKKRKEFGNAVLLGAGYCVMESFVLMAFFLIPYLIVSLGPEGGSIDGILRELRVFVSTGNLVPGREWRFLLRGYMCIVFALQQVSSSILLFIVVRRGERWYIWLAAIAVAYGLLVHIPNRASSLNVWYWGNMALILPYMGIVTVIGCLVAYAAWKSEYKDNKNIEMS